MEEGWCAEHQSRGTKCPTCRQCLRCPVPTGVAYHSGHRTGTGKRGRRCKAEGEYGDDDDEPETLVISTIPSPRWPFTHLLKVQGPNDARARHLFSLFYDRRGGSVCVDVDRTILHDPRWLKLSVVKHLVEGLSAIEEHLPHEVFFRPGPSEGGRPTKNVAMTLRAFVRWFDVTLTRTTIVHPVLWTLRSHLLSALYDDGINGMVRGGCFVDGLEYICRSSFCLRILRADFQTCSLFFVLVRFCSTLRWHTRLCRTPRRRVPSPVSPRPEPRCECGYCDRTTTAMCTQRLILSGGRKLGRPGQCRQRAPRSDRGASRGHI